MIIFLNILNGRIMNLNALFLIDDIPDKDLNPLILRFDREKRVLYPKTKIWNIDPRFLRMISLRLDKLVKLLEILDNNFQLLEMILAILDFDR